MNEYLHDLFEKLGRESISAFTTYALKHRRGKGLAGEISAQELEGSIREQAAVWLSIQRSLIDFAKAKNPVNNDDLVELFLAQREEWIALIEKRVPSDTAQVAQMEGMLYEMACVADIGKAYSVRLSQEAQRAVGLVT